MPEVQSFLTLQGLQAYGIILTEQQYLALCSLVDNYTCACLAKLQQAQSAIAQTATQAQTAIETSKTQAIAHIDQYGPMVICTEGEYPAQPEEDTMYFRFPNV